MFFDEVKSYFADAGVLAYPLAIFAFFAFFTASKILLEVLEKNLSKNKSCDEFFLKKIARRIKFLSAIIVVAPLLGLLGTVIGMMQVFEGLGKDTSEVIDGIAQALITTQIGLSIAILTSCMRYFCKHFARKIEVENQLKNGGLYYENKA